MKFSPFRRIHFPAGKRVRAIALLGISAFVLASGEAADAAEIRSVRADVSCVGGEIPPSVSRRIRASIEAIGGRVLTGKEDRPFLLDPGVYDKALADIVNRVVVGYIVSDIQVSYGEDTRIHVTLQPIGRIIQSVDTEIEYGNLTPEAAALIRKDLSGVGERMQELLIGLPVDSVGWAESVSQSAGRDFLASVLPEFQTNLEVESGEHTRVRIYLIPQGKIIRTGALDFRETSVPRVLMYRAAEKTERTLQGLEGLPVAFVQRHQAEIEEALKKELLEDSFIRRYEIEIRTALEPGEATSLKVDALTDHWYIRTEAWLDAGRDGNRSTALDGILGHYAGRSDLLFGEARLYPGPMDWNIYAGWMHRFGKDYSLGAKYDFTEDSGHILGRKIFGDRWAVRYERDLKEKINEYGVSYRIHNYMTLEYVYNDEEGKWLRLIANL